MSGQIWRLNSSHTMPIFGLGTYRIQGEDLILRTLDVALQAGYRLIDTAGVYHNEEAIGKALQKLLPKYGLQRKDLFITSKLAPGDQGTEKCRAACLRSLQELQTDYLDLYLIHWPGVQKLKPEDPTNAKLRRDSWVELEKLHNEGKLRSIGVSNYNVNHLQELLSFCKVKPAVLQSEFHPHLIQEAVVKFCNENQIKFQAYSSLGTTKDHDKLLSEPVINEVARQHQKTVAQILLRWAIQQDLGVLPKSTYEKHIKENIDVFSFSLTQSDMTKISSLHQGTHYCWNPEKIV